MLDPSEPGLLRAVARLADSVANNNDEDPSWGYLTCEEAEVIADILLAVERIDEADKLLAAHVGLDEGSDIEAEAHPAFFDRIC